MSSPSRTVKVKFDGDAKGLSRAAATGEKQLGKFQRGMSQVGRTAGGFGKAMGGGLKLGMLGLAGLAGGLLAAAPKVFDMAGKLQLLGNKAKIVFGPEIGSVEAWAKKTAHGMGLTKREAVGLAAGFADLLIPMGFTRKQAAGMAKDTIGLSGALSEWSGGALSAAEVSDVLSAAYLGERDGLQQLGISISQAEVDAALLAKGQDKLTGKQRQQAEATATQALIFSKSKDAQKAYADGAGSLARKTQENKARLKEMGQTLLVSVTPVLMKLGDAIGKHVLPVMEKFVTWLSGPGKFVIADWALSGSQYVLEFVDSFLAGLEGIIRFVGKWGKGMLHSMALAVAPFNQGLAKSMWDAGNNVEGFSDRTLDSLADARKGIKTAETAIEKAKLVAKLNADKSALDAKLAAAREALKDPKLTKERKAKLNADIAALLEKKRQAQAAIDTLHGKTVTITANVKLNQANIRAKVSQQLARAGFVEGRAIGGPVVGGRTYLVGEKGPELVTMGGNGRVTPNHELAGGDTYVYVEIDGQQLQGRIVKTIKDSNRQLKRTVKAA